jgi:hypothetical protein
MYDIVKEDGDFSTVMPYSKYRKRKFKCGKCGSTNDVLLMWSVVENKDRKYTPVKEVEWAEANKYKRAVTNSGKVHYVTTGCWQEGKVEPFCNCRSWLGDYWGKKWKLTDKPVTCKNCLSRMRRMMKEESANEPKDTGQIS